MHTILLADDDNDDAEIFAEALLAIDSTINFFRVDTGGGVLTYLANPSSQRPDLIFLDLNMPEMNGWQCLAKLKNTKEFEAIPVIIYTTSSNPRDKEIANDLRAHGLITKPSNPKTLDKILELIVHGIKHNELKNTLKDAYILSKS
jgi:CheY-like chemotaxis protein